MVVIMAIPLWAILAVVVSFIYAIVAIVDKIAISREIRDPIFATFIFSFATFVSFGSVYFFKDVFLSPELVLILLGTGLVSSLGVYFYYSVLEKEEVSSYIPMLSTSPIFVLILAFILLGEKLGAFQYLGILVIVVGALVLSLNEHKIRFNKMFWIIFGSVFLFSLVDVAIKFVTLSSLIWPVLFWIGIGQGFVAIVLFAFHHPKIRSRERKGLEHLIIANILTVVAWSLYLVAISLGSVTLIRALTRISILFVFLMATGLTVFYPKVLKEKISKKIVIQKFIGIAIIISGAVMVI